MRTPTALAAVVLAGGLLAVPGRINGDLSGALGGPHHAAPVVAATVSFAVGALVLLAAVVVAGGLAAPGVTRQRRALRLLP